MPAAIGCVAVAALLSGVRVYSDAWGGRVFDTPVPSAPMFLTPEAEDRTAAARAGVFEAVRELRQRNRPGRGMEGDPDRCEVVVGVDAEAPNESTILEIWPRGLRVVERHRGRYLRPAYAAEEVAAYNAEHGGIKLSNTGVHRAGLNPDGGNNNWTVHWIGLAAFATLVAAGASLGAIGVHWLWRRCGARAAQRSSLVGAVLGGAVVTAVLLLQPIDRSEYMAPGKQTAWGPTGLTLAEVIDRGREAEVVERLSTLIVEQAAPHERCVALIAYQGEAGNGATRMHALLSRWLIWGYWLDLSIIDDHPQLARSVGPGEFGTRAYGYGAAIEWGRARGTVVIGLPLAGPVAIFGVWWGAAAAGGGLLTGARRRRDRRRWTAGRCVPCGYDLGLRATRATPSGG